MSAEKDSRHAIEPAAPDDLAFGFLDRARAAAVLAAFLGLTMPLMPVQALLLRTWPCGARRLPHWYHRQVCRLLGIRIALEGEVVADGPVLLIANHTSWLDIPVISAIAPVSFVAKSEVGGWPLVSQLARLQRTVFVDRKRRSRVGATAGEMIERLALGDTLVLFAEGTSSDGNRVLPFRTSLLAAAKPTRGADGSRAGSAGRHASRFVVQPLAIVYTRLHGVPLGRMERALVGWYGDMDMVSHGWRLLQSGPIDVVVRLGKPVPLEQFHDRKALARHGELAVRSAVVQVLRGADARAEAAVNVKQSVEEDIAGSTPTG